MRLVISLIVETEDAENLVVLLGIRRDAQAYRLALGSIHLEIGSSRQETLCSDLEGTSVAANTLSKHYGLCGEHGKRFLGESGEETHSRLQRVGAVSVRVWSDSRDSWFGGLLHAFDAWAAEWQ